MKRFECVIELGTVTPTRLAKNKKEFVEELIKEYNSFCGVLFEIDQSHIKEVKEQD